MLEKLKKQAVAVGQFLKSAVSISTNGSSSPVAQSGGVVLEGILESQSRVIFCRTLASTSHLRTVMGFPGGSVVENLPANAGDMGSSPGLGRPHMPWSN